MKEQARNIADLEHRLAHTKTATDADAWTREELLAVHKLARSIRVARQPEESAGALLHLVGRVLDVIEAEIFVELEESDRQSIISYMAQLSGGETIDFDSPEAEDDLRELLHTIMSTPEFQLG